MALKSIPANGKMTDEEFAVYRQDRWKTELTNSYGEFWKIFPVQANSRHEAVKIAEAQYATLNGGGWHVCSCNPL